MGTFGFLRSESGGGPGGGTGFLCLWWTVFGPLVDWQEGNS